MKSLINDIEIGGVKDALNILAKAGNEELIEKAKHQIGDSHPKWPQLKWTDLGGGKFGWRTGTGRGKRASTSNSGEQKDLSTHAKDIDTKTLKNVVDSDKAPKELKDAAKKELQNRGEEQASTDKTTTTEKKKKSKHQIGDSHPTWPQLKWTDLGNGKFGWRTGTSRGKKTSTSNSGEQAPQAKPAKTDTTEKKEKKLRPVGTGTNGPERRRKEDGNFSAPNGVKLTIKQQQQLNEIVDKGFLVSSNKYNDTSKMKIERTPKGNWLCYYDGKNTGNIIDGKLMSESLARKLNIYQTPVFTGNVGNAIKSSGLFGTSYVNGRRSMGNIASINIGDPNTRNGNTPATVIYTTPNGSYKTVSVTIDADGKVTKDSGWQSSQAFSSLDDAKSYIEYGRRGRNTFTKKWDDEPNKGSNNRGNQGKTGEDFNIVGARAKDVADNVASVLGGKVTGNEIVKVSGVSGVTIKAHKITVGNDSFFIHDGVFEPSYSQKGYARYKGFTVMKSDGSRIMKYKVNSAGNRFTNAYSTNAGQLGLHIKSTWGYGK